MVLPITHQDADRAHAHAHEIVLLHAAFRYYAKRCFLSLIEMLTKHMLMLKDSSFQEIMVGLCSPYWQQFYHFFFHYLIVSSTHFFYGEACALLRCVLMRSEEL